jgi:hypothetical protein
MFKSSMGKQLNSSKENTNPGGEYQQVSATSKDVPSTIPSKSDAKSAMMDGPYGGKKPA